MGFTKYWLVNEPMCDCDSLKVMQKALLMFFENGKKIPYGKLMYLCNICIKFYGKHKDCGPVNIVLTRSKYTLHYNQGIKTKLIFTWWITLLHLILCWWDLQYKYCPVLTKFSSVSVYLQGDSLIRPQKALTMLL